MLQSTEAICRRKPTFSDAHLFLGKLTGGGFDPPCCFLTGSLAFGEESDSSDIDIALPIMRREEIVDLLKDQNAVYTFSDYNDGIKVETIQDSCALTVNLVFLHPLDYVAWFKAGLFYMRMPRQIIRESRHAVFENLRANVKCAFALAGIKVNQKNYQEFLN